MFAVLGVLLWVRVEQARFDEQNAAREQRGVAPRTCDVPMTLWMLGIAVYCLYHSYCHKHALRLLAPYHDELRAPLRVRVINGGRLVIGLAWAVAGVVWVAEAERCPTEAPDFYRSLQVLSVLILAMMVNTLAFFSCRFCLLTTLQRWGLLRSPVAAPDGTVAHLPLVPFDPETFRDDGACPAECPVCIAEFGPDGAIRRTPCGHVFHETCLQNWLLVARTCPCCRADVARPCVHVADLA